MPPPRPVLLSPIHSLISAFAAGAPSSTILTHFTASPIPLVHEHGGCYFRHGLPFLGRDFIGLSRVGEYFDLLAEYLSYRDMVFESEDDWVVDPQNMTICLRGQAQFTYKETGESWNETFMWRVTLSEDLTGESEPGPGQGLKVQEYQVWADTAAVFLASRGELKHVAKGTGVEMNVRPMTGSKESDYPAKHKLGDGLSAYGSCG
ncbi:hypothetical protein BGW36DRAFT_369568 [Talaromyces proteolyticus]|uniref:Uncharacterized protein n=1 Tax=Talaromyces proteolyticus TaxID=1131652 RepID=A0AAD4Q4X6_9EURO|nr:uncharacterized protein BGW36DRAFT_369568 [Talaromyces proteolyticus]KAH8703579.1 hypothetical protein BGW36DRAFT_369568 [Talaromyces proteolyticus]